MPKQNSKRLVIDASVAKAAGGIDAVHPQPKSCRDFLIEVRECEHQLVMTGEIRMEWNKHQSRFAQEWRSSMVARKQFAFVQDAALPDLTPQIDSLSATDKQLNAMRKDSLLAECAIVSDRTVAALDDTVRRLFAEATSTIIELKQIVWVNPSNADEASLTWLQNGAPPEPHRQLQNYIAPN